MVKAYAHPVEDFPREGYALADSEHERIAMQIVKKADKGILKEPDSLADITEIITSNSGYKDKELTRGDLAAIMDQFNEMKGLESNPYTDENSELKKGGGSVGKLYTNDKSKYHGGTIYQRPTKEE